MSEWRTLPLSEVVELRRGFDLPHRDRRNGPYPVVSAGTVMGTHDQGPVKGPGFAVGRATNLGVPTWSEGDYWPLNTTLYAADFKGNDPEFLFRLFQRLDLSGFDSGSVQPMLNRNYIAQVKVRLPPLSEQRGIAEVLGALDDKIAANTRFLTTARELVDAELDSALAASAETRTVDDLAAFHNRRRVPLSANQRKERAGDVPYYGAAGPIDTVDVALFDEEIVLVGEDGSVMTERGAPVVQYVWGPSWVNNHAHVLTGSSVSTPFLRVLMERGNVAHLVTGAVQPKLSMGNLKRLELSLPADSTQLQATVDAHAAIERAKKSESRLLAATRNALLPLLMSGKVRVQDAESVVGEVL